MRYAVRHSTVYEYGGDVAHSHHLLHLKPRDLDFQRILKHSITLHPEPSSAVEGGDAFGNPIARLEYDRPHDRLSVTAEMEVEVLPRPDGLADGDPWEEVISHWLECRESASISEILQKCINKPQAQWAQTDKLRAARCLRAQGWVRYREREGSRLEWRYRKAG